MFNKFKYRKTLKMIAHFDALIADVAANPGSYYYWSVDKNGKYWKGHEYEITDAAGAAAAQDAVKKADDWLAKLIDMAPWPKQNEHENAQMQELLHEEWNGESLTRLELLALIRKYPPEVLETVLPCVMVMYLLRESDINFDSDTEAFGKFFTGWQHMVIHRY
jgi:hypothetical protein